MPDSYLDGIGVWRCLTCLQPQPCGQDHTTRPVESPQFGIDPMAEILGKIHDATALRARELTDEEWQKLADDTGIPIRRLDGRTMIPASRRQEQDHEG